MQITHSVVGPKVLCVTPTAQEESQQEKENVAILEIGNFSLSNIWQIFLPFHAKPEISLAARLHLFGPELKGSIYEQAKNWARRNINIDSTRTHRFGDWQFRGQEMLFLASAYLIEST